MLPGQRRSPILGSHIITFIAPISVIQKDIHLWNPYRQAQISSQISFPNIIGIDFLNLYKVKSDKGCIKFQNSSQTIWLNNNFTFLFLMGFNKIGHLDGQSYQSITTTYTKIFQLYTTTCFNSWALHYLSSHAHESLSFKIINKSNPLKNMYYMIKIRTF